MALPLVLAGPILRRVDAKSVSAFVALSRAATVEMRLWAGSQMSNGIGSVGSGAASLASGQATTRRIGANLHLVVVTIDLVGPPAVALAPGALHSYDIVIDGTANLQSEQLLRDERENQARIPGVDDPAPLHLALGYDEDRLPGFVTPAAAIDQVRIAHTSCRRTNFPGYDAMGWLDDWIKDHRDDPTARPQQLFLTGDQIYADDLGTSLLPMLTRLGEELLGGRENFPVDDGHSFELTPDHFPPQRRGKIVRELARLSTTDSKNHLLGLGEFAAMYLAAWSSRIWRPLGDEASMFMPLDGASAPFLSKWEDCFGGSLQGWKDAKSGLEAATKETKHTELFRDIVPKAARALANCSTYMIFDDHEITDDWNLTGRWLTRVYSKKPGQAIIRNGMIAYGLFQGWGNDPSAFKTGNNKDFLDQAEALFAGAGPFPVGATNRIDEILGFPGAGADKRAVWHYAVDGPRHRVVVLDTRTLRDTGGPASTRPPKLLGGTLGDQLADGPLTDGRELLIVVSAPPVLGPTLFDKVLQPLASTVKDMSNAIGSMLKDDAFDPCKKLKSVLEFTDGDEQRDVEGWAGDEGHQEALLKKLATYPKAVILSGDVHYSSSLTLDYWRNGVAAPSRIVQLTCSGARNGWPMAIESQFRKSAVFQNLLGGVLVERVAWNGEAKITLPDNARVGPGRRGRMKRSPSLLPVIGWPAGTTMSDPPDWRWRLKLVRDIRTGGQNGAPPDPPTMSPDVDPDTSFAGYVEAVKRHALLTIQQPRLLRTMMFLSNIGLVSFKPDGGDVTLVHQLLSASTAGSQSSAINTEHVMSLAPSAEAQPVLVTG